MFRKIIEFLVDYWTSIIIFMVIVLFLCFIVGYFANAILLTKFELASCWAGIVAVSGPGVLGIAKYYVDSKHNSTLGEKPYKNEGDLK